VNLIAPSAPTRPLCPPSLLSEEIAMLGDAARKSRYLAQTGRRELTARQRRRAYKKWLHQSEEALVRREGAVRLRMFAEADRKRRHDVALRPS
jgi:hypothetical protein